MFDIFLNCRRHREGERLKACFIRYTTTCIIWFWLFNFRYSIHTEQNGLRTTRYWRQPFNHDKNLEIDKYSIHGTICMLYILELKEYKLLWWMSYVQDSLWLKMHVIYYRIQGETQGNISQGVLVLHLKASDFLMGLYLFIISIFDLGQKNYNDNSKQEMPVFKFLSHVVLSDTLSHYNYR